MKNSDIQDIVEHTKRIKEDVVALQRYLSYVRSQGGSTKYHTLTHCMNDQVSMAIYHINEVIRLCEKPDEPAPYRY